MRRLTGLMVLFGLVLLVGGCGKPASDSKNVADKKPVVDELIQIVEPDGDAAEAAAGSLGGAGKDAAKAVPALVKALESSNPRTRIAAAIALFDIDSESEESMQKVVTTIIRALTDEDDDVQREALRLLSRTKRANEDQVKAIAKALTDNNEYVSAHAAEALVKLGARSVPVLIEAAKDPKSVVWAVLALGDIGPEAKSAQATIVETAKDADPLIRQESAFALAKIQADPDVAIPTLKTLLEDKAPMVQAAAAHSLVQFGPSAESALGQLEAMTTSADPLSRIIGALALIELKKPQADAAKPLVDILLAGLDDEHPVARRESAKGLGKLGSAAAGAKEKLDTVAAKDADESVREAAGQAAKDVAGAAN